MAMDGGGAALGGGGSQGEGGVGVGGGGGSALGVALLEAYSALTCCHPPEHVIAHFILPPFLQVMVCVCVCVCACVHVSI